MFYLALIAPIVPPGSTIVLPGSNIVLPGSTKVPPLLYLLIIIYIVIKTNLSSHINFMMAVELI